MGLITVMVGIFIFCAAVLAGYGATMFIHWVFTKISGSVKKVKRKSLR